MQTVAVLDAQSASTAKKALDGLSCLVLTVDSVEKARYLLMNMRIDLFICDLETEDLDFNALISAASVSNPDIKTLVTGTSSSKIYANQLVERGEAMQFLLKPWQILTVKQAINTALTSAKQQPKITIGHKKSASSSQDSPAGGQGSKFVIHKQQSAPQKPQVKFKNSISGITAQAGTSEHGRYRIDEIVGSGGAGKVCKAFDTLLDMTVAIKFLNSDLIRDESAIEALKAETRICLQLQHKHIVRIYNLEKRGPNYMLIMEYIKGDSLYNLISQYPEGLPLDFVSQVTSVATGALGYAHRHGVLHKDITPGNILITEDGVLKIIDFGIADQAAKPQDPNSEFVTGTPIYMSPEHIRGEMLSNRSDIYSLGVLIKQLLTGSVVSMEGATLQDLAYTPHPPITGLPLSITQVLESATAFSPADRYESMEDFGKAFAAAASIVQP